MDYRFKITEKFWVEMLSTDACYNHGSNIVGLVDGLPNFLSPQVKLSAIISNKHGEYELPHELPNYLINQENLQTC